MTQNEARQFCGPAWLTAEVVALPVDASDRRFYRVMRGSMSLIVVDSSHEMAKVAPYASIAEQLRACGFSAPIVYDVDDRQGWMVLEDLGTQTIGQMLAAQRLTRHEVYTSLLELLPELRRVPQGPYVHDYSVERLLDELAIFVRWYCYEGHSMSMQEGAEFLNEWKRVLEAVRTMDSGSGFVHKDFHLDNMTWIGSRAGGARIGLLDFQDAKYGPHMYDVVSLLEDPRHPWCRHEQESFLRSVCCGRPQGTCDQLYAVYAVQRGLKILGNIYCLALSKSKPQYLGLQRAVCSSIEHWMDEPLLAGLRPLLVSRGLLR